MPCYSPVPAWFSREVNPSGRRNLVFSPASAMAGGVQTQIPCGQCIGCRLDRSMHWAIRLQHEARDHLHNWFVTLSYSDEHLPSHGGLVVSDCQGFMKRLRMWWHRHQVSLEMIPLGIRFFLVGEYGDQTARPHYHAILFGVDFPDMRFCKTSGGSNLFVSKKLDELWGLGNTWIGGVTPESCGYVARYSLKKITGDRAEAHYTRIDSVSGEVVQVKPEFCVMSRRPGIGARYAEKYLKELYSNDSVVIRGGERTLPKFYDKKIAAADPGWLEDLKAQRKRRAAKRAADSTPERLKVREEVKRASIQTLKRNFE